MLDSDPLETIDGVPPCSPAVPGCPLCNPPFADKRYCNRAEVTIVQPGEPESAREPDGQEALDA